jgi:hypothetical protein
MSSRSQGIGKIDCRDREPTQHLALAHSRARIHHAGRCQGIRVACTPKTKPI